VPSLPELLAVHPQLLRYAQNAVRTIDVESDKPQAFGPAVQALLEACSDVIAPLWQA